MKVPGLPRSAADSTGRASVNDRSPSGRIHGSEGQNVLLRQFARQVDGALRVALAGRETPLIPQPSIRWPLSIARSALIRPSRRRASPSVPKLPMKNWRAPRRRRPTANMRVEPLSCQIFEEIGSPSYRIIEPSAWHRTMIFGVFLRIFASFAWHLKGSGSNGVSPYPDDKAGSISNRHSHEFRPRWYGAAQRDHWRRVADSPRSGL